MQGALIWKTALLWALLAGSLLSLSWLERRLTAWLRARGGVFRSPAAGGDRAGLLRGAGNLLKRLARAGASAPSGEIEVGPSTAVSLLRSLLFLAGLAVIPWGSNYALFGGEFQLVISDLEIAAAFVVGVAALAACTPAIGAAGGAGERGLAAALRSAARTLSAHVALFASLVAMVLIYGTLDLGEMVLAQQSSFRALGFLPGVWPAASGSAWIDLLWIPAWGIALQPLALAVFLGAALAWTGGGESAPPRAAEPGGDSLNLWWLDRRVQDLLMASFATCVFLGGWSLPWLSDARLLAAWTPALGADGANLALLLLHPAVFGLKVAALLGLFAWVRAVRRQAGPRRVADRGRNRLLPLALGNVVLTAAGVAALGAGR